MEHLTLQGDIVLMWWLNQSSTNNEKARELLVEACSVLSSPSKQGGLSPCDLPWASMITTKQCQQQNIALAVVRKDLTPSFTTPDDFQCLTCFELLATLLNIAEELLVSNDVKHGTGSGTHQWVASECGTMVPCKTGSRCNQ